MKKSWSHFIQQNKLILNKYNYIHCKPCLDNFPKDLPFMFHMNKIRENYVSKNFYIHDKKFLQIIMMLIFPIKF